MTILAALVTIFAILRIVFGRHTVYEDSDGQHGEGTLLSLLWIYVVYAFVWFLFLDKLPDWLLDFGFIESIGLMSILIFFWIERPSYIDKKKK